MSLHKNMSEHIISIALIIVYSSYLTIFSVFLSLERLTNALHDLLVKMDLSRRSNMVYNAELYRTVLESENHMVIVGEIEREKNSKSNFHNN
jgi:hypothetical protein